ncbi:MAG: hypothetical protein HY336_00705 [Candidatus Doudnabacteria bacterium]|nr:hypothetical protein [Candidatus Doudnabacteria bacterium]
MRIDSYIKQLVEEGWHDKETLVVLCARRLGQELWDYDSMYGRRRDRDDHEAKVARLGFALGISTTPKEFLAAIEKIETLEDQRARR